MDQQEQSQRIFDNYDLNTLFDEGKKFIRNGDSIGKAYVFSAYERNFDDKTVHFNMNSNRNFISDEPNHILVEGSAYCRVYLSLFNRAISKILIVYDDSDLGTIEIYQDINVSISKHCANSLQSIAFKCAQTRPTTITLQGFQARFNNVTIIHMENVDLNGQLPQLARRCPNVQHLKLHDVSMVNNDAHFRTLTHLEISYSLERTCDKLNEVRSLLQSSKMLESLHIEMPNVDDMDMDFLLNIINEQRQWFRYYYLSKLIVKTGMVSEPLTEDQGKHLERYKNLTMLNLGGFRIRREYADKIWNKLKHLRTFIIRIVQGVDVVLPENRLVFMFVRNDTGHKVVPIRRRERSDAVIFRRT